MVFDELMRTMNWRPVRNCPGRFVLHSQQDLNLDGSDALEFKSEHARDSVLVLTLDKGGIISYRRENGSILHTLNTPEGFKRKLKQLGIGLPEIGRSS
jgi:hypothetical protein